MDRSLMANVEEAGLQGANLARANLVGADLRGAHLEGALLVGTNLKDAKLTGCWIYGISAWDLILEGATQSSPVISPENEPAVSVDDLEVAQLIYLLLNNARIRQVIDTIGKKAVLILGRFATERKVVLDSIRDALRRLGFLPILFDFDKPGTRDRQETIVTLASLSRFVVADITDPKSIPQELASIVPTLPSVPATIAANGVCALENV